MSTLTSRSVAFCDNLHSEVNVEILKACFRIHLEARTFENRTTFRRVF
jgi:hypothetical protein